MVSVFSTISLQFPLVVWQSTRMCLWRLRAEFWANAKCASYIGILLSIVDVWFLRQAHTQESVKMPFRMSLQKGQREVFSYLHSSSYNISDVSDVLFAPAWCNTICYRQPGAATERYQDSYLVVKFAVKHLGWINAQPCKLRDIICDLLISTSTQKPFKGFATSRSSVWPYGSLSP